MRAIRCPECKRPVMCCGSKFWKSDGLSFDELAQACKNIGYNLECGACAELFFTGSRFHAHDDTCPKRAEDDDVQLRGS